MLAEVKDENGDPSTPDADVIAQEDEVDPNSDLTQKIIAASTATQAALAAARNALKEVAGSFSREEEDLQGIVGHLRLADECLLAALGEEDDDLDTQRNEEDDPDEDDPDIEIIPNSPQAE